MPNTVFFFVNSQNVFNYLLDNSLIIIIAFGKNCITTITYFAGMYW